MEKSGEFSEFEEGEIVKEIGTVYKFKKCLWRNIYTSIRRYAADDGRTVIMKTYELDHPNMSDKYKKYFYKQVLQEYKFCKAAAEDGCFMTVLGIQSKKKFSLSQFPIIKVFLKDYVDGDLKSWRDKVRKSGEVPAERIVDMAQQIIHAVKILDKKYNLVHRDLKPDNFFLEGDKVIIADLENAIKGTPEAIEEEASLINIDYTGSTYFRPPDLSKHFDGSEWDVYSLGFTLTFLVTGYLIYEEDTGSLHPMARNIVEGKLVLPEKCPDWLKDFIKGCLQPREKRIEWWNKWCEEN